MKMSCRPRQWRSKTSLGQTTRYRLQYQRTRFTNVSALQQETSAEKLTQSVFTPRSSHPPTWWLHHVNFDRCKLKCALKTALPRRYCTKKKHEWLRWRILCPRWAAPAAVTAPSRGSLVRIWFCFHPTCYTTTIAAHCSKNSSSLFSEMIPRQTPDGHHELGSNLWEAFTGRILPPPTSGEQ